MESLPPDERRQFGDLKPSEQEFEQP